MIQTLIEDDIKLLHTSDVLGPCTDEQTEFIIQSNPDILISDGPMPFYLDAARLNIRKIIDNTNIKTYMIDHHFLRDKNWKKKIASEIEYAQRKNMQICTAAEYSGIENDLLEAHRKKLYKDL